MQPVALDHAPRTDGGYDLAPGAISIRGHTRLSRRRHIVVDRRQRHLRRLSRRPAAVGRRGENTPMPTKRTVLAEMTAEELRANVDYYELAVADRRVKAQLVDALAGSRRARVDEILGDLSRDRLKALCRALGLDDSGRRKADLVVRLMVPAGAIEERRQGSQVASAVSTSRSSVEPDRGGAERRPARAVPLVGGRHPARVYRQQRLQDLHLRPAVPEAAVGPLRGRGAEAHRRRHVRDGGVDRSGRAPVLRAGPGAVGHDPEDGHQHRRGAEQGVRGTGGAEQRAGGRPRRHRLQRRAEARRREEPRHRARASGACISRRSRSATTAWPSPTCSAAPTST